MKAYYFVFFLMFIISLLYQAKNNRQWRWKLFWTYLPLFVYGAIRVDYGNDYSSYEELFNLIHSFSAWELDSELHVEVGYQLLNRVLPSFRLLLVINSFLLCFSFAVFCYHNVPKKFLWLVIILIFLNPEKNIFGSLVGIRNGLVVASFLIAFILIQKRKWMPFFLITFILSTIHTSTLLFLPLAFIVGRNTPFSQKEIYFWIGGSILILAVSMTQLFNTISFLISNDVFDRYEVVLENASSHRGIALVANCMAYIILFIVYLKQRGASLSQNDISLLRLGLLFSTSLLLGSLSMRASYFYDMFFIGSVVKIVSDRKASNLLRYGLLFLVMVSSYYSMFKIWMASPWWNHAVYHSLLGSW